MLPAAVVELADQQRAFSVTCIGEAAQPFERGAIVHDERACAVGFLGGHAQRFGHDRADAALGQCPVELVETLTDTVAIGKVRRCSDPHDAVRASMRPNWMGLTNAGMPQSLIALPPLARVPWFVRTSGGSIYPLWRHYDSKSATFR